MMTHLNRVASVVCVIAAILSGCARSEPPAAAPAAHASHSAPANVSADDALRRLVDGNARFVASTNVHPNLDVQRRLQVRQGQTPFAIILGCSDSRVPADLVFDTGLGDLFVVRVAGNVTDDVVIGSIEYAVDHLGTNLVLVLGHEKCGAVDAALHAAESHDPVPGHINSLVEAIEPAIRELHSATDNRLDEAVRANVRYVTQRLRHAHPILSKAVEDGKLNVVGAYYDLETGQVQVIDPP